MKTLNEIMKEWHSIEDAIFVAEGELTPEIEKMLDDNSKTFEDKLDRYAGFIAYQKSQIIYLKERQEELKQRAKSAQNVIDSMRDRMMWFMKERGVKGAKTAEYTYSLARRKVYTLDQDAIPDSLDMELTSKGYLTYNKKYDVSAIKKNYQDENFVLTEEKDVLNLR